MKTFEEQIHPDPDGFSADPLGYGALSWHKWAMVQNLAGHFVDLEPVGVKVVAA